MLSVLRGSQCLSAAVLQGQTVTIRRAAWAGRSEAPSLSARVARRSLPAGAGMAQCGVPLSHKGNVQTVTSDFLSADSLGPGTHLHLILLNYVLPPQTAHLWQQATTRICADGGANRLYDQIPVMLPGTDPFAAREAHLPDLIKGDLDSVRADVTDFYTSRGVPFIDLSSDQETTDLEKCLLFLEGRLPRKRLQQDHLILVLGALGGRLDHTLANLNTLYCYPHLNITLWGEGNLVRLLRAGRSVIKPSRLEGPTCGLVPLARPATASSKGLKWDLDDTHVSG
ncbi:thiamine pyrophosphokinase [Scenedesmus sp. NREL 46B-D3]|nr:thiamine pyrophosphokinase [Scenedesmus sp. NREL 46B-D3]